MKRTVFSHFWRLLTLFLCLVLISSCQMKAENGDQTGPESNQNTTSDSGKENNMGGTIIFDSSIIVRNDRGETIASGKNAPTGKYYATVSSTDKLNYTFLLCNGNEVAAALNGSAVYEFEHGEEQITFSSRTEKFSLTGGMQDIRTDLEWLADESVICDNGKYYMAASTNWGKKFGKNEYAWEVFEAKDLIGFGSKADMKEYCIMSTEEFAATPGVSTYTAKLPWAPELQKFGDYYYITTTYICTAHGVKNDRDSGRTNGMGNSHRTLAIFRSTSPTSGWEVWCPHIDAPMTGTNTTWDLIDGIIYYEDGKPYMVASHEWTSQTAAAGGSFAYVQLKDDLSGVAEGAEWHEMFYAKQTGVAGTSGTTDGPYLYKNSKGELLMLWSAHEAGYCVLQTKSSNGKLNGTWSRSATKYLYNRDRSGMNIDGVSGGHPGLVQTPEGQLYLTLFLNMVESDKNKIPHLIAVRENNQGYLEWGIKEDLLKITVSAGASKQVDLLKNIPQDHYSASFTIVKDGMPYEKYLGFRLITEDRRTTSLLINSAGKFKVGNGNETSFEMPDADELTLTIICLPDQTPNVYLNGVLNTQMTDALEDSYSEGEKLSTLQLALYGAGATAFFKDWSVTTGTMDFSSQTVCSSEDSSTQTTKTGEILLPPQVFNIITRAK